MMRNVGQSYEDSLPSIAAMSVLAFIDTVEAEHLQQKANYFVKLSISSWLTKDTCWTLLTMLVTKSGWLNMKWDFQTGRLQLSTGWVPIPICDQQHANCFFSEEL